MSFNVLVVPEDATKDRYVLEPVVRALVSLMAAIAVGLVPPEMDWTRIARVVERDPATAELYAELYAIYRDFHPATREQVHRLAAIQER